MESLRAGDLERWIDRNGYLETNERMDINKTYDNSKA
jgi:hypothetical protein